VVLVPQYWLTDNDKEAVLKIVTSLITDKKISNNSRCPLAFLEQISQAHGRPLLIVARPM